MSIPIRRFTLLLTLVFVIACGAPQATPTAQPTDVPAPATSTVRPLGVTSTAGGLTLALTADVTMELVRIPAGEFIMGSADSDSDAQRNEKPQHKIILPEYLIGRYDVTNAQYEAFIIATARRWTMPVGKEEYPVVNVTWRDAVAFCQWLGGAASRSVVLPSEAMWEKAARGTDGRKYPWGNQSPDMTLLNFNNNVRSITVVGHYSPQGDSPYGLADMAGNVRQWTSSLMSPYPYRTDDGRENQASSDWRVVRGGGYIVGGRGVRSASRESYDPISQYDDIGFRVVVLK